MNKLRDQLEEILQAAEEIETASIASLSACGFQNEEERLVYIKQQAAEVVRRTNILLGYDKG